MSEDKDIQVVIFGLGAETFAVPVIMVREILELRELFRIPNGPDYLLGLTDMRGKGVATVDLRLKLGMNAVAPTPATRILVVDIPVPGRTPVLGLVVDRVLDVCSFSADDIEAASDIGIGWRPDFISGVVRRDNGFVVMIDMGQVFSRAEVALLDEPPEASAA